MKQPGLSCSQEDLHEHLLAFPFPLFFKLLGETEAKELCIMTLNFLKLDNFKICHISTLRRLTPQLLLAAELVSRVHNAVESYVKRKNKPLCRDKAKSYQIF